MNIYNEGMNLLEEKMGQGKDNVIALATIALELSSNGLPCPRVRDVDAYYHQGSFYIVTHAKSNKVRQIMANPEVSISANLLDFTGVGQAVNLGWVKDPKNAEIRETLRKVFSEWYDFANNEEDENCVFVAIHLTHATLRIDHGVKFYHYDFLNQLVTN